MERWRELLASGEPGEIEARLRRHDGVYRWFLIRVEPLRDETADSCAGTEQVLTLKVLSKPKRSSAKRNASFAGSRTRYRRLSSSRIHPAPPVYANQATLDYTGLTVEDVISPGFRERIFHPDDLERLRDFRKLALERGLPFEIEQRALRKDGQYRWFLIRYNPFRNEEGRSDSVVRDGN